MIRTNDDETTQADRTARAKEILFKLFNAAAAGSLRPWQQAFYNTQHAICYLSGDDSFRPDAWQLEVLESILAENTERIEL